MDLSTYKWPEVTKVDMAFSTLRAPAELVAEAKQRSLTKARAKFSELFFSGGTIVLQPDVRGTWKEKAYLFAKSLMGSFEPKHQDKEAVCALIFSEVLVLD